MTLDFEETRDLWKKLESWRPHFSGGGRLQRFGALFDAAESLLFVLPDTAPGRVHVRDAMDVRRLMGTVVVALLPCIVWGMWNVGQQELLGETSGVLARLGHGARWVLPTLLVSCGAAGICEAGLAIGRRRRISASFLVTGVMFPLVCPPTLPLWIVAVGISFGTIFSREVFHRTRRIALNPALTAQAFVLLVFPAHMSLWRVGPVDAASGATPLAVVAATRGPEAVGVLASGGVSFAHAFLGLVPGSTGEVSTLACLLGAALLVSTGVGAWRIMVSMAAGGVAAGLLMNAVSGPQSSGILHLPPHWHLVLGGFAFGCVYMATDPVSAAATHTGKLIYGFLTGVLAVSMRVVSPTHPEGVMPAILLMNGLAPVIDRFVVQRNIRRRRVRLGPARGRNPGADLDLPRFDRVRRPRR